MSKSSIEWTEYTFNPWWGCTKVSEGCAHCYAETFSKRVGFSESGSKMAIWGDGAERRFSPDEHWDDLKKWNAKAAKLGVMHRVFCGSMCDILEDRAGLEGHRDKTFDMVESLPNLLFLFLSKRPQNAAKMFPADWAAKWPRNVMLGVTIENQPWLDERMMHVGDFLARFRGASIFASCEPLLSALDWRNGFYDQLQDLDWVNRWRRVRTWIPADTSRLGTQAP